VLHPFVRVHVIDMSTQKYLAKEELVPCMQTRESVSLVDAGKNFQRQRSDFVQPFSTSLTDLRRKGQMMAEWEDEFVINERVAKVLEPEVVFLFELLDFCPDLAMTQPELLNSDHFYPIAWAYLRPIGMANVHVSTQLLQLYRYKAKVDKLFR
jgi:jouberin